MLIFSNINVGLGACPSWVFLLVCPSTKRLDWHILSAKYVLGREEIENTSKLPSSTCEEAAAMNEA